MSHCDTILIETLNAVTQSALWIVDENIGANVIAQVCPNKNISAICNRFDIGEQLTRHGIDTTVNDYDFSACAIVDNVVYRVSKERALVQHCICYAFKQLNPGGQLIILGEKNDGLKTHAKFAASIFDTSAVIEKKGLCYLSRLTKSEAIAGTHFDDLYSQLQLLQQGTFKFYSKPGIYGWKKVDTGSRLLIDTIKPRLAKMDTTKLSLLDLGCGYGYLQLALADLEFARRLATDNNAAAIVAAEKNFAEQNLAMELSLDDCGTRLREKVDLIVCNPPFHQGFSHDKALINRFVQRCITLLANKGRAYFVVNEFIPLPKSVEQLGGNWKLLAHEKGFKVYAIARQS